MSEDTTPGGAVPILTLNGTPGLPTIFGLYGMFWWDGDPTVAFLPDAEALANLRAERDWIVGAPLPMLAPETPEDRAGDEIAVDSTHGPEDA